MIERPFLTGAGVPEVAGEPEFFSSSPVLRAVSGTPVAPRGAQSKCEIAGEAWHGVRKLRMRERQFKRVAFASTLLGIVLIAVALQRALVARAWAQFALLGLAGLAIALVSVFTEIEPEAGFVVTLYTREGCTLCDAARAFLVGKKAEYDFDVWEIDVDRDAAANARYSDWVPVATVGDEELFRLAPEYPRLEARLRELADRRLRR